MNSMSMPTGISAEMMPAAKPLVCEMENWSIASGKKGFPAGFNWIWSNGKEGCKTLSTILEASCCNCCPGLDAVALYRMACSKNEASSVISHKPRDNSGF